MCGVYSPPPLNTNPAMFLVWWSHTRGEGTDVGWPSSDWLRTVVALASQRQPCSSVTADKKPLWHIVHKTFFQTVASHLSVFWKGQTRLKKLLLFFLVKYLFRKQLQESPRLPSVFSWMALKRVQLTPQSHPAAFQLQFDEATLQPAHIQLWVHYSPVNTLHGHRSLTTIRTKWPKIAQTFLLQNITGGVWQENRTLKVSHVNPLCAHKRSMGNTWTIPTLTKDILFSGLCQLPRQQTK